MLRLAGFLIALFLPVLTAYSALESRHLLFERVAALSQLNLIEVNSFARDIAYYSDEYKLDPYLVTAIIYVESRFKNFKSSTDFGPMQVNRWWLKKFKLKKEDLLNVGIGIETGVKILALMRVESDPGDPCWWSLYHSRKEEYRRDYEKRIIRTMRLLGKSYSCNDRIAYEENN